MIDWTFRGEISDLAGHLPDQEHVVLLPQARAEGVEEELHGRVPEKMAIPGGYPLATRMRQEYTIYFNSVAVNRGTYLAATPPEKPETCAMMRVTERAEKVKSGLRPFKQ